MAGAFLLRPLWTCSAVELQRGMAATRRRLNPQSVYSSGYSPERSIDAAQKGKRLWQALSYCGNCTAASTPAARQSCYAVGRPLCSD